MSVCRLKPGEPAIAIVDGPFAGRKYFPNHVYDEIPAGEADRFEPADKGTVTPVSKRGKP